jgi:methionyl aminopeptidase
LFHTRPDVYHCRTDIDNGLMKVGHTFTIEPMICKGAGKVNKTKRRNITDFFKI